MPGNRIRQVTEFFSESEAVSASSVTNQPGPASSTRTSDRPTLAYNEHAVYIRHTGTGRGLGLYASKAFPKDHRILLESPLVSCKYYKVARKKVHSIAKEWRKLGRVGRQQFRDSFRKLKSIPLSKELKPAYRKKLERFVIEYGFGDHGANANAHIYKFACHINHACAECANVSHMVDSGRPHKITVRLRKEIQPDEEILIPYGKKVPFGCSVCKPSTLHKIARFLFCR